MGGAHILCVFAAALVASPMQRRTFSVRCPVFACPHPHPCLAFHPLVPTFSAFSPRPSLLRPCNGALSLCAAQSLLAHTHTLALRSTHWCPHSLRFRRGLRCFAHATAHFLCALPSLCLPTPTPLPCVPPTGAHILCVFAAAFVASPMQRRTFCVRCPVFACPHPHPCLAFHPLVPTFSAFSPRPSLLRPCNGALSVCAAQSLLAHTHTLA